MSFHETFLKIVNESGIADQIPSIARVSPETSRRWIKGKLLPGRKKLFILMDHLQLTDDSRKELLQLHSEELKDTPKWGKQKSEFARLLNESFGFETPTEISRKTGITQQSLRNWKDGILLPSVENILKLAQLLQWDEVTTDKLIHCRNIQKLKKPSGRKSKSLEAEDTSVAFIKAQLPSHAVTRSLQPYVSFYFNQNPVVIHFPRQTLEVLFTRCCIAKMNHQKADIYLLVQENLRQPFAQLFKEYQIDVLTVKEFLKIYAKQENKPK